uniref:Uncharacterized protein n=1 Tax=Palpitomonas bilix TaxID=652834 RepID=A0A7S3DEF4_9EUKA|mmetsp:Transcript_33741/g.86523  ORF Transcript_33741/g.86523 Transcript_33741/m.86523 type:complete len:268 (+) Transcript_33741:188-991(+)|eukprot:CAMPEP_0113886206 /NCGR_PEP_ID=MMETSP0780_2-20120614/11405_1 /TAXON_ID=652834 /ORGANISM="Palpitomonas bilix" /LENGTH=267 /DNA_ID=CAMNT_0000874353 /DNA_START=166 /DNA_END=969 /DNA_ORIENTATION=- /assembly_acc=CAM_ASM_000599
MTKLPVLVPQERKQTIDEDHAQKLRTKKTAKGGKQRKDVDVVLGTNGSRVSVSAGKIEIPASIKRAGAARPSSVTELPSIGGDRNGMLPKLKPISGGKAVAKVLEGSAAKLALERVGNVAGIGFFLSVSKAPNPVEKAFQLIRHGHAQEVQELLDTKKIDIHEPDADGNKLIHASCHAGNKKILKILLRRGADINSVNDLKQTPLHFAIGLNYKSLSEYLIRKGADLTIRNIYGLAPSEGMGSRPFSPSSLQKEWVETLTGEYADSK